jgi:hypothetical protein
MSWQLRNKVGDVLAPALQDASTGEKVETIALRMLEDATNVHHEHVFRTGGKMRQKHRCREMDRKERASKFAAPEKYNHVKELTPSGRRSAGMSMGRKWRLGCARCEMTAWTLLAKATKNIQQIPSAYLEDIIEPANPTPIIPIPY